MDLRLSQEEAANQLQVDQASVHRWETGRNSPKVQQLPRIIEFLGYDPYPPPRCLAERLKSYRRATGLLQRELAAKLKIPRGTLAGWERVNSSPSGQVLERVRAVLGSPDTNLLPLARS